MKNHISQLSKIYTPSEAKILVRQLMCHITGMSLTKLLTQDDISLTKEQNAKLEDAVSRLARHEPIQHVIGYTDFYGFSFMCDKRALIPRPETEELTDWIVNDHKSDSGIKILDIGTGTGCIAISLDLSLTEAEVTAMDISLDALSLARENSKLLNSKVDFLNENILKAKETGKNYSIIVSNPPYVRECEKADMEANVLDYDPSLALFVSDDDPLIFYRAIAEYSLNNLAHNGHLYFEINQYLDEETCQLLSDKGYTDIQLRNDMNGNARMIRATRP